MDSSDKKCPFCAETIKAEAIRCKHCQADLSKESPSASSTIEKPKGMGWFAKTMLMLGAVVVAFLSFAAYKASTPEGKQKSRARAAIEVCRDRESTYRGSENARSILEDACEKMEEDFRA